MFTLKSPLACTVSLTMLKLHGWLNGRLGDCVIAMDVCNAFPGWPAKQETPVLEYRATTLYSNICNNYSMSARWIWNGK